eukprot:COSAG02_NODE_74261_length_161_cov_2.919355_1_plen_41_part_01
MSEPAGMECVFCSKDVSDGGTKGYKFISKRRQATRQLKPEF